MKKTILIITVIIACLLMIPVFASVLDSFNNAEQAAAQPAASPAPAPVPVATPVPTPVETVIRFSATGDNLIHNGIYQQAARRAEKNGSEGYDFSYCFDNVREFYSQFDINWLNQETLVNTELAPSTYPCFSTPGEMGQAVYDLGMRVFSLSNNHSYDQGAAGISATLRFWNSMPEDIVISGLYDEQSPEIAYQENNGVKFAYLSYTEHTNGLPTPANAERQVIYTKQLDVIQEMVQTAQQNADVVVVSTHWGVEGSHQVTDAQRSLAQSLADWGADVIIGTGPHMVQDAEWLTAADGKKCFVAYSLGNFLNAQSNADCMIGAVLTFDVKAITDLLSNTKKITVESPKLIPVINHYDSNYSNIRVYMYKDYTAELAASHGVRKNMPSFSLDYIESVLEDTISTEFLDI